ncbi:hypothetical protein D3C72_2024850 [compost metagenome]
MFQQVLAQALACGVEQTHDITLRGRQMNAQAAGFMADENLQAAQLRWVQANGCLLQPLLNLDLYRFTKRVQHLLTPARLRRR